MAVETYATLLNLKLVVPASKSNYVAVNRDFWISALSDRLSNIDLDEVWYCEKYKDVASAIEAGFVQSARQHYCESGYFEHRMPYAITVDPDWYLLHNEDVREAVSNRLFASAQQHFEDVGYREGRHPFANFALRRRESASTTILTHD